MKQLYFAYGSNMNLFQMEYRCPEAVVTANVTLNDYRLAFRGRNPESGVATILPEKGSQVKGVLWRLTNECERSLDIYEGFPHLYGKEMIRVADEKGTEVECIVYIMNSPFKDQPAIPSKFYLNGIIEGCKQNGIETDLVKEAVERTRKEILTKGMRRPEQERKGLER